jgi:hypothetical protein
MARKPLEEGLHGHHRAKYPYPAGEKKMSLASRDGLVQVGNKGENLKPSEKLKLVPFPDGTNPFLLVLH